MGIVFSVLPRFTASDYPFWYLRTIKNWLIDRRYGTPFYMTEDTNPFGVAGLTSGLDKGIVMSEQFWFD